MMILSRRFAPVHGLEAPVFVVGCCNSGTTILWRALREHPQLSGPPVEGQDLSDLPVCMRHFLGRRTFRMFAHPRFRLVYRAAESACTRSVADRIGGVYREHCQPGRRLIEKSPANALRTRLLQHVFPDATFVVITRDPYAVSEGIVRKRRYDPERPHMEGLETTIRDAALQWRWANEVLLADASHLRSVVALHYEDLVAGPAAALERVRAACGLVEPPTSPPVFERGLNRAQVTHLGLDDLRMVHEVVDPLARTLGYAPPVTPRSLP
jgi:hypothetical protein